MRHFLDERLMALDELIDSINLENLRQLKKWGVQDHTIFEWLTMIMEEVGELSKAILEFWFRSAPKYLVYNEAIHVATLVLKVAEMFREREKKEITND